MHASVTQSCPTTCNPMDCSLPGSSVQGILQTRTLEWAAMAFSRGSSPPRDRTCISCVSYIGSQVLYLLSHQGNPGLHYFFNIEGEGTAGRDWLVDNAWEGRSSIKAGGLCYLGPDPSLVQARSPIENTVRSEGLAKLTGLVSGAIGNRPAHPNP